ncbi:hypothetical protein [Bradyrhizobium sp. NBAIM01]|uniref:hypothetical protein n=1 Tax=Bradyrhizobium sp. NBAIM01 TaxID=2793818 RepID=UPI001CD70E17|nr:hypothetical protein [Bradyrhizobium sp. NBAIM01]MCA1510210.1 hypothetical protein [Bradyrhizobium sp. NBAIM01]
MLSANRRAGFVKKEHANMAGQNGQQTDGLAQSIAFAIRRYTETSPLTGAEYHHEDTMVWSADNNFSMISSPNHPGDPEIVTAYSFESVSEWLQEFPSEIERVLIAYTHH